MQPKAYKDFLKTIAEQFNYLFEVSLHDLATGDPSQDRLNQLDGLLTWDNYSLDLPTLKFSTENTSDTDSTVYVHDTENCWQDGAFCLNLAKRLQLFQANLIPNPLTLLPLSASLHNQEGTTLSSNHKPSDPYDFLADDQASQDIPNWIRQDLQASSTHSLHLTLPAMSSQQILIQSYYGLVNEDGSLGTILQLVQDIKPLLASYLKDSGQALVGWSDTTSGASIHNDHFDFEEE
ncbi:hypothetical protein [Streptococcus caprae]|uniref:Uncharacterized protein n=2 Tax=Streptococcus caprae TaxID=1640501 RepID=A0ABV8CY68_9STRE